MTETIHHELQVPAASEPSSRFSRRSPPNRSLTSGQLARRRLRERREMQLYSIVGFLLCLPVVAFGRLVDGVRGRGRGRKQSLFSETYAKVSAILGFVYMA